MANLNDELLRGDCKAQRVTWHDLPKFFSTYLAFQNQSGLVDKARMLQAQVAPSRVQSFRQRFLRPFQDAFGVEALVGWQLSVLGR